MVGYKSNFERRKNRRIRAGDEAPILENITVENHPEVVKVVEESLPVSKPSTEISIAGLSGAGELETPQAETKDSGLSPDKDLYEKPAGPKDPESFVRSLPRDKERNLPKEKIDYSISQSEAQEKASSNQDPAEKTENYDQHVKEMESAERVAKALEIVENPDQKSKEIIETTVAAREAKAAFISAYKKELAEQNKGFGGKLNRIGDRFFGKGIEMSEDVQALREAYFESESRRRLGRYERMLEKTDKKDKVPEYRAKIQKNLRERIEKEFKDEEMLKYEAITKEKSPTFEKMMNWTKKRSRAEKLAFGTLAVTAGAVAFTPVALGGAAGFAGLRLGRAAASMLVGSAAIKGMSALQTRSANKLTQKTFSDLDSTNPFENMKEAREAFRKNQEAFSANQRKWMLGQIGAGVLLGGLAGGLAHGGVESLLAAAPDESVANFTSTQVPEQAVVDSVREEISNSAGGYDQNTPFESSAVPPIDGSLDGSPQWQDQQAETFNNTNVESKFSTTVEASSKGAIADMENLKTQLQERFSGVSQDKLPDTVRYMLENDATTIAQELGMYDPSNPAESAATLKGQTYSYTPDGKITLNTPGVEQGDVLLSDNNISMDGKVIKDGYGGAMFDSNPKPEGNPGDVPAGVDPEKLTRNGHQLPIEQNNNYVNDIGMWIPGTGPDGSMFETPSYGPEQVANPQFRVPEQAHVDQGFAFYDQTSGRNYYYNHAQYPNGNPFGMELPEQQAIEQTPNSPLERMNPEGSASSARDYLDRMKTPQPEASQEIAPNSMLQGAENIEQVEEILERAVSSTEESKIFSNLGVTTPEDQAYLSSLSGVDRSEILQTILGDDQNRFGRLISEIYPAGAFSNFSAVSGDPSGVPALAIIAGEDMYKLSFAPSSFSNTDYSPVLHQVVPTENDGFKLRRIDTFDSQDPNKLVRSLEAIKRLSPQVGAPNV